MVSKNGYYSVEDYNKQRQQQEKGTRIPPKANVLAAANHIRHMFDGKKFVYGIFGGLAMLCLGYRREQPDLHIAYDDKDFHRIKAKLEADSRIRLPDGMNSLFPAKILIRTGPAYKDEGCTQAADIELDLVPPGSHGTPTNGNLASNLVLLSLKTEGKLRSFKGLNLLHLLKTSVHYAGVRELSWDPRKDVLFLCQNYGPEVQSIRNLLDHKAVQQNFLGTAFFSRLPPQEQRICYQILLGTEPPPTMAITPPGLPPSHKHSASASSVDPRPRISAHKSTPTLNTQVSSSLLSPPVLGKAPHKRSASAETRPTELPAPNTPQSISPRDSRSRYRPISAPNDRERSPQDGQPIPTTAQTKIRPSELASQPFVSHNVHHRASFLPQLPSNLAPSATAHSYRQTPNMNGGFHGTVPQFAFAHTPLLNGSASFGHHQQHTSLLPAEMSATSIPLNPGQHHLKSQAGLGGGAVPARVNANKVSITERPPPPQARSLHQVPSEFRAELSGTPMLDSHAKTLRLDSHIANLPSANHVSPPVDYGRVEQAPVELGTTEHETIHERQMGVASNQPTGAVELDSISPIGHFIAELSVDRATPAPTGHFTQMLQSHGQDSHSQDTHTKPHITSNLNDSPVSPPDLHAAIATSHEDITVRPLNPRTYSAPPTALPSSLLAGRPAMHQQVPSNTLSHPPATAPAEVSLPQTNASRYTRYYASFSTAASTQSSPPATATSTSQYQAYHPPSAQASIPQQQPPHSAPLSLPESQDRSSRPFSFIMSTDVDGAEPHFQAHRRDASHDSQASKTSLDSSRLADEYRAALPDFEGGYVSPGKKS